MENIQIMKNHIANNQKPHKYIPKKLFRRYLFINLIILAITLRMIYGYGLEKKIKDESTHLNFAKTISIKPGMLNLPMGNTFTHHPVLVSYITAVGYWVFNGSIYGIRTIYIIFSVFGLMGLYHLTLELFGYRPAIIAFFLAAVDHHLISYAPELLEPVYLCLVPWALLFLFRAVELQQENYWILLGVVFGVGYLCSEIFLLMGFPVIIVILSSSNTVKILKNPKVYVAAAVFFLLILPSLIWNYTHQFANIYRHSDRLVPYGIVPRGLLFYLGNLLINLKDSSQIVMGLTYNVYGPWTIPCHWISGIIYLVSVCYSFKYIYDRRFVFLLIVFWSICIPISLINAKEPWNEIEWAAMSIFPAICLTAYLADRLISLKAGRIFFISITLIISIYTVFFLHGPKCGYYSPFWEKTFVGNVICNDWWKTDEKAVRKLVEDAFAKHPDSVIVNYFQAKFCDDPQKQLESFKKIFEHEKYNPLAKKTIAEVLNRQGRMLEARALLSEIIARGNDFLYVRIHLSILEFKLGNYHAAEKHCKAALKMKPDKFELYQILFHIYEAQGKFEEGLNEFEKYAMTTEKPWKEYLKEAEKYAEFGDYRKADIMFKRAQIKNPDLSDEPITKLKFD